MSTPSTHVAVKSDKEVDRTVEPSAIAKPGTVKAHAVGEVLKVLVQNSLGFPTEDSTDAAVNAITDWVGDTSGMDTEGKMAPREDVSQRVPPGYGGPATAPAGAEIDYDKLAAAIVKAQGKNK